MLHKGSCLSWKQFKSHVWASLKRQTQIHKAGKSTTTAPSTNTKTQRRGTSPSTWTHRWTTASSHVFSRSRQSLFSRKIKNAQLMFQVYRHHQWTKHFNWSRSRTSLVLQPMVSKMSYIQSRTTTNCKDLTLKSIRRAGWLDKMRKWVKDSTEMS